MKTMNDEALKLLKELLVDDTYKRAIDRDDELGLNNEENVGLESILERLVSELYPDLFNGDINGPNSPSYLRNGESPLEMHLESGTGSSFVKLPGVAAELLGQEQINFDVPDTSVSSFFIDLIFGGEIYTYVNDVNLKPADGHGRVEMEWHPQTQSLKLTIEFESSGTEIKGTVEADFDEIMVQIFLKPILSRGRILWEYAVRGHVSVTDSNIERTKIIATEEELKDDVTQSESNFVIAGGGGLFSDIYLLFANDDNAAEGLADGLAGIVASILDSNAELIGNALLALPLRPTAPLAQSTVNRDFFLDLGSLLTQNQDPQLQQFGALLNLAAQANPMLPEVQFETRELLLFQLLGGELDAIVRASATGEQNLVNILPLHTIQDAAREFHELFTRIVNEWLAIDNTIQNTNSLAEIQDFYGHILKNVVAKKFQEKMFDTIEIAHVVNRTVKYTEAQIIEEEGNNHLSLNWEDFDQNIAPQTVGVPCMQYKVSLENIVLKPSLHGFLVKDTDLRNWEVMNGVERLDENYLEVEWEVYSFHEAFEDPLDTAEWIRDNSDLLPGVRLLKKAKNPVRIKAGNTGLEDAFSKNLFLEWNTNDLEEGSNCKLLITGRVIFEQLQLSRFNIEIPMHKGIGMFNADSRVLEPGEVDNITSFKADGFIGNDEKKEDAYTIYASLIQQPFSSAYQSVNASGINFNFSLAQDMEEGKKPLLQAGMPFFMEGRINGRTFQTSPVYFVSNGIHVDTVTRGITKNFNGDWSADIIYPEESIGESFELEFIAHALNPEDLSQIFRSIPASKTIHRFTTLEQERIAASDRALESSLQDAVDAGAALEWGIPIGLPFAEFFLTSEDAEFNVKVRITNKNFVASKVPAIQRAKDMQVDFIKAKVGENGDWAEAEIKFYPKLDVNLDGTGFSQNYDLGSTRRFDLDDNETVNFPGPPSKSVSVKPDISELKISCFGKDFDNPRWGDSHDSLGTARILRDVPIDDSIDGVHTDNSNGPKGDFTLHAKIETTSPPPPPRFRFEGYPTGIDLIINPAGAVVDFEYEIAWADQLILQFKNENTNGQFENVRDEQPNDLSGRLSVAPEITTTYRLIATNVVTELEGPVASQELIVDIN